MVGTRSRDGGIYLCDLCQVIAQARKWRLHPHAGQQDAWLMSKLGVKDTLLLFLQHAY